jgi:ubiquitin-conjugating enzyme E2 O
VAFVPSQPNVFTKRLLAEIKALRASPMTDVFVKANEDRLHTFKFAISGSVHTPYYGGFYCFDLALPVTFPLQPPVVRFHSRGLRINPNLYEDGYVCLSLLGTWSGTHQCEQWSPTSTLRQVLLSVQAIILCQEPYYNEAGFESLVGTPEGQAHSRMYNETTALLKVSLLMSMAQAPPPDWGFEFREHYKRHVPRLLQRWRRYLQPQQPQQQHDASSSTAGAAAASGEPAAAAAAPAAPGGSAAAAVTAGLINADGLVAPLSPGLRAAMATRIEMLQSQYDRLKAKWDAEQAAMDAAYVGSDD